MSNPQKLFNILLKSTSVWISRRALEMATEKQKGPDLRPAPFETQRLLLGTNLAG
jgi:hypothetical protein